MPEPFTFLLESRDGNARCGSMHTKRGIVHTPAFMPVGTTASVKGLTPQEVLSTGAGMILANTYHLLLRPGVEVIRAAGGVSAFMAWEGPMLTDSGGYQILSLAKRRKITDEGVTFASHLDGSTLKLSPATAVEYQKIFDSDIAMVLDECPPADADALEHEKAVKRTTRWASESLAAHDHEGQALFGIMQGGTDPALRKTSLEDIAALDMDGYALGGLGVGEGSEKMHALLEETVPLMPSDRPRYLMGIGTPSDIIRAVCCGVDMFDCVLPTRNGRNGQAFTMNGRINIRNARWANDAAPIDSECNCSVCSAFERRYIRHLFVSGEMLGPRLVSLHNLHHYGSIMKILRNAIEQKCLEKTAHELLDRMDEGHRTG